jgi:hypothetical protein
MLSAEIWAHYDTGGAQNKSVRIPPRYPYEIL